MSWPRERILLVTLLAIHTTLMVGVLGLVFGWWSSDAPADTSQQSSAVPGEENIDAPEGSLVLITATPGTTSIASPTPSPTPPPPTSTPSPAPPTSTPHPRRTPAPAPTATAPPVVPTTPPVAPAAGPADFSGQWRIVDVVTQGENAGQRYSFDVGLTQQGNRISGGNGGIQISGIVRGDTATLEYVQPALGYTGTFVWTMVAPGRAEGTFTNSYPNAGSSSLQRLR